MKRKLILKTIACLLMLGGCVALTTCTKQKPNVLKTQQVKRANDDKIEAVNSNIKYIVDTDLTYYTTFYFIRNTTNETANIYFTDDNNNTYQNNISLTKDYEIMVIYNTYDGINLYYYDLYYYDIFDSEINVISQQTELLNIQDKNINLIEVNYVNAFVGGYVDESGDVNSAFDGWADEGDISGFYRNNYLNYIQPHLLGDAQATINQLLIDYRDAMRENQALQQQVSGQPQEISSLNERIDNLNSLMNQQEEEYETIIATKEAVIENLQELDNLPTHLGGWFELVIDLLQNLWNMELLPHIKLGYFVALPILFTLVSLIIKLVRGA